MNLEAITLNELNDAELDELLADSGKGKPAVYRKPIADFLSLNESCNISFTVSFTEINPNATERQTVLAGIRQAIKKNPAAVARRMTVKANTDDDLVTVVVGKAQDN